MKFVSINKFLGLIEFAFSLCSMMVAVCKIEPRRATVRWRWRPSRQPQSSVLLRRTRAEHNNNNDHGPADAAKKHMHNENRLGASRIPASGEHFYFHCRNSHSAAHCWLCRLEGKCLPNVWPDDDEFLRSSNYISWREAKNFTSFPFHSTSNVISQCQIES